MRAIVAADLNWGIGKGGDLLFRISPDLKRFRALTTGHPVLMGRKTLESFPSGKPLPNRRNLVLSRCADFSVSGGEVYHSVAALLAAATEDAFVIGGGEIYGLLLPYCDTVYVTRLLDTREGYTFFPNLDIDPSWRVETGEAETWEGLIFRYDTYFRHAQGESSTPV